MLACYRCLYLFSDASAIPLFSTPCTDAEIVNMSSAVRFIVHVTKALFHNAAYVTYLFVKISEIMCQIADIIGLDKMLWLCEKSILC